MWLRLATAVMVAALGVALGRGGWRSAPPRTLPRTTQAAPSMALLIPGPTADLEAGAAPPPERASSDAGRSMQPARPPRQGAPARRPPRDGPPGTAQRVPAARPPAAAPPSAPVASARQSEGGAVQGASSARARGEAGTGTGSSAPLGRGLGSAPGVAGEAAPAGAAPPTPSDIVQPHVPRLIPPKVITSAGTEYPVDAFRLTVRRQDLGPSLAFDGAEGTVGVRALVLADGTVGKIEVSISSGSAALDHAAAEAVRGWRFLPATRDGDPIDAYVTVKIRYVVR